MLDVPLYNTQPISEAFLQKGIPSFDAACRFVQQLRYGRNTDKTDSLAVLREGKGTCSSKHALLKTLADELGHPEVQLFTGIFFMQPNNLPQVKEVLEKYNIPYIPEAHCYLKYEGKVYDYTFPESSLAAYSPEIVNELEITPAQITDYKIAYHRMYLGYWIAAEHLPYSLDEIWEIREACIQALGQ